LKTVNSIENSELGGEDLDCRAGWNWGDTCKKNGFSNWQDGVDGCKK